MLPLARGQWVLLTCAHVIPHCLETLRMHVFELMCRNLVTHVPTGGRRACSRPIPLPSDRDA